jgi:hypothetical protein
MEPYHFGNPDPNQIQNPDPHRIQNLGAVRRLKNGTMEGLGRSQWRRRGSNGAVEGL